MDQDGYPEDDELKKIEEWPWQDFKGMMEYIKELWRNSDSGYWKDDGRTYYISTSGWSGNESIIEAMHKNFIFWSLCWHRSERGGHYKFVINKAA